MALIALEGMRFHAYHGTYPAERLIGTVFIVDLYVQSAATSIGGATDALENTINYESVYQICQAEMGQPRNLIEAVVAGIIKRMKHQFGNMISLKVRVRKLNPPLGGTVQQAYFEEEETYMSVCPRCQKPFINYTPSDCWARFPNLYDATKETLVRQYGGKCLCDNCLKFYAG
jgi:7,8-dihydroneopterin aldolase/epimerase/oxygenase